MNLLDLIIVLTELTENSIEFIPEAHCYLKINGKRTDLTSEQSELKKIEKDIIEEREIEPKQVAEYKIDYHKKFMKSWLKENWNLNLSIFGE